MQIALAVDRSRASTALLSFATAALR